MKCVLSAHGAGLTQLQCIKWPFPRSSTESHTTYWQVKVLCMSYEFMSASVMSHSPRAKPFIYHSLPTARLNCSQTEGYSLQRGHTNLNSERSKSQTLIVCEKSQTFQSTVTVRACQPHWQLHHRKYLNLWLWSAVWGESWCAKQPGGRETWSHSSSAWKKKKNKKEKRIRQSRPKRSPRSSTIRKHIILFKWRVPGYGRDYKGNTGWDCIHGLGYCTYGAQQ